MKNPEGARQNTRAHQFSSALKDAFYASAIREVEGFVRGILWAGVRAATRTELSLEKA